MSPKAEPSTTVVKKQPPARDRTPNRKLDIGPALASSAEMFSDLEDMVEYLRVLYFGREGSGKSTNAALLANTGRILYINAEGGAKKTALAKQGVNTANVRMWPQKQGDPITHEGLDRVYYRLKADLQENPDSWHGVVIDSSTDVTQGLTDEVSENRIMKARNRGSEIDHIDEYFTDVSDYGTMTKMFVDTLRKFRDLPLHVVYTALERRDIDKQTSEVTIGPAVTPGVATSLLGYVDIVIHCSAADETNPFRGLTNQGGRYRVKDRFGILPRIMAEPNMLRIMEYAEGKFDEEPDPLQAKIVVPKSGKKKVAKDTPAESLVPPDAD